MYEVHEETRLVEVPARQQLRTHSNASHASALGAAAIGAIALGATAFGALAIGRLAIGALALKRGRLPAPSIAGLPAASIRS
jgi:hypothetical protein